MAFFTELYPGEAECTDYAKHVGKIVLPIFRVHGQILETTIYKITLFSKTNVYLQASGHFSYLPLFSIYILNV